MMVHAFTEVVLPVFAVAAMGWAMGRWGQVESRTLTTVLLYLSLPALLFDSLARRAPEPAAFGTMALGGACVCMGLGLVAWVVARMLRRPHRGLVLTSAFMNAGNFGLPIAVLAWGPSAFPHAVTFYVTMAMLQATVGIWVAQGSRDGWREVLRIPMIHAALLGLAVNWLDISLPAFISKPAEMVGQTGIPLMLIALGLALQAIRPSAVITAFLASVLRMAGGLLLGWLFSFLAGLEGQMRQVLLLSSSMPAAVMNLVLAERYEADQEQVATTVLVSTLLAALTVPAVIAMLR